MQENLTSTLSEYRACDGQGKEGCVGICRKIRYS